VLHKWLSQYGAPRGYRPQSLTGWLPFEAIPDAALDARYMA
jgi:hypothetical protein